MVAFPAALTAAVERATADFDKLSGNQKYAVAAVGGAASVYLISSVLSTLMPGWSLSPKQAKPSTFGLTGGSIDSSKVAAEFSSYSDSYGKSAGEGITDRSRTVQLVDVFYSLVTDIYEWGWGQSFHFSPKLPGKDLRASEAAHEARIAALLNLKPGMKALDCGCGVGGPMRTISAVSGAHVTGITINQYQVDRATAHNAKASGRTPWCMCACALVVVGGGGREGEPSPGGGGRGGEAGGCGWYRKGGKRGGKGEGGGGGGVACCPTMRGKGLAVARAPTDASVALINGCECLSWSQAPAPAAAALPPPPLSPFPRATSLAPLPHQPSSLSPTGHGLRPLPPPRPPCT